MISDYFLFGTDIGFQVTDFAYVQNVIQSFYHDERAIELVFEPQDVTRFMLRDYPFPLDIDGYEVQCCSQEMKRAGDKPAIVGYCYRVEDSDMIWKICLFKLDYPFQCCNNWIPSVHSVHSSKCFENMIVAGLPINTCGEDDYDDSSKFIATDWCFICQRFAMILDNDDIKLRTLYADAQSYCTGLVESDLFQESVRPNNLLYTCVGCRDKIELLNLGNEDRLFYDDVSDQGCFDEDEDRVENFPLLSKRRQHNSAKLRALGIAYGKKLIRQST